MRILSVFSLIVFLLSLTSLQAQKDKKAQVKLSGFVGAEAIYDTRDQVASRSEEVILYPKKREYDKNGVDLTDNGGFFMSAMTARVRLSVAPYELFGGTLTAFIEADFANRTNKNVHMRLRHAVMKFDKGNTTLLIGQYWNPMTVDGIRPGVASIGVGAPYPAVGRNPQIRLTQRFSEKFRGSIIAMSQLDNSSTGPDGKSEKYMRQAKMPEFDAHLEYGNPKKFLIGAVGGVKTIKPRLKNEEGNKVDESITSMHGLAYIKYKTENMEYKIQGIYAENSYDMTMLGGYGVSHIDDKTGEYQYEALTTSSIWGDIKTTYDSKLNFGVYAGITQNLGADKELKKVYARGSDIEKLVRISPRIVYGKKAVKFMFEVSQNFAYYGTPNAKYEVKDAKSISSTRLHLTLRYHF